MRIAFPFVFKAVAIYGLLAITHALPSLPRPYEREVGSLDIVQVSSNSPTISDGVHGSLDPRMVRMMNKLKDKGKGKDKDDDKKKDKGKGPGRGGPSGGGASPPRPNRTPEEKGAYFMRQYKERLDPNNPNRDYPGSFEDYNKKKERLRYQY